VDEKKDHQTLCNEYQQMAQFVKTSGQSGGMLQLSLIMVMNSLRSLKIPHYEVICPLLLFWAIFAFSKAFLAFLRVEKDVAHIIVDGITLEKRHSSLENYFHDVLDDFSPMKIISIRSLVNFAAFGSYGYFLSRLIADLDPDFTVNYAILALISAMLTAITCKLYLNALKSLIKMKEKTFRDIL